LPQALSEPEHAQRPPLQSAPAAHVLPQVPQFCGSVAVSTQAPLQTLWAFWHTHAPLSHMLPAGHTVSHMPQLLGSVGSDTQLEPPHISQEPWPRLRIQSPIHWMY
jgi:hypothetical protein